MQNNVETLEILLNTTRVGYLSHYQDGKNIFIFDEQYIAMGARRPTLSLSFTETKLQQPQISTLKLPPFFSNLLPEGALRQLISEQLKIHLDDEFALLKALGHDLPGAVIAKPINDANNNIPATTTGNKSAANTPESNKSPLRFSLAGVQMKFSVANIDGRLTIPKADTLGHYIVKTPSNIFPNVPENEYSMMQLATNIGIETPMTELVPVKDLVGLPKIKLPREKYAYLIERFDRDTNEQRIHIEDFAQVFGVRSNEKYSATNYDSMAKLIHELFPNGILQLQEFMRRIVFNILIGNSDAHLQNWSIIYRDRHTPQLTPAYDLVSTLAYLGDHELALNFAKQKNFYQITLDSIKYFAKRISINEKLLLEPTLETIDKVRQLWPSMLNELPLSPTLRKALTNHWHKLSEPFKLMFKA